MEGIEKLIEVISQGSPAWFMSCKERILLVSLLHILKPKVVIELGVLNGGFTKHIAEIADEIYCVDVNKIEGLPENVKSFTMLTDTFFEQHPDLKADMIIVDAGHQEEFAYRDMKNSINRGRVILMHDTGTAFTRRGYAKAIQENIDNIVYYDLDFIEKQEFETKQSVEIWGGIGIVIKK